MKKLLQNKKNMTVVAVIVAVVLVIGGMIFLRSRQAQRDSFEDIPQEAVIPTVDSSVLVELKETSRKSVATLTIKNAPKGTKKIEYQVSYDAKPGPAFGEGAEGLDVIPQGFQGTCKLSGSIWACGNEEPLFPGKRVIVFGSSSSGVYRFHEIVGKVKVELIFTGSYGQKRFEKEFEL